MTCSGPHDRSVARTAVTSGVPAPGWKKSVHRNDLPPSSAWLPEPRAMTHSGRWHIAVGVARMVGERGRCCASTLRQRRKSAAFSKQQAPRTRGAQPDCAHFWDGAEGEVRSSNRRRMLPSVLLSQPHPNPTRPTHLTSPDLRRLHPCRLRSVRRSPNQPTRRRQAGLSLLRVAHRAAQ